MSATRLESVALTVSDTDRLTAFYVSAFGATVAGRGRAGGEGFARLLGLRDAAATVTRLLIGEEAVSLFAFDAPGAPYPADARSNDLVFQHFALVTADIEAAWARARAAGAEPIGAASPVRLPASSGGVAAIKFRDPDGHPLELLQFPPDATPRAWAAKGGGDVVRGIDHSAIAVEDTGRAEAFYAGLLGLEVGARSVNVGPEQEALDGSFNAVVEVTALELRAGRGPHVELLCNRIPATGRPIPVTARPNDIAATRLHFAAGDLDATVDELIEKRCRFVSRHVVAQADGSRAAAFADPDGHVLVLREGREGEAA